MNMNLQIILLVRLGFASLVGGIIGWERTVANKPAGIATYSIICITSAFLTQLSMYGFSNSNDPTRLVANIITAICFVSSGVIYTRIQDDKKHQSVTGITTGATIFCTSALGIGVGIGQYILVIGVVVLIEFNIFVARKVKRYYNNKSETQEEDDL